MKDEERLEAVRLGSGEVGQHERGPLLPQGGYCLFTVGAVGAGKSTLQNAIIHRLHTDESVDFTVRNGDGDEYHDPELQEWVFRFDRGEFPKRTSLSDLRTFFIEFG